MVLVTGATGILGRVIVLKLLEKGIKVRATKRPKSNLGDVRKSFLLYSEEGDILFQKIEWVDVDFGDLHQLQNILEGVTDIYHCAAKISFDPKDEKPMVETNIFGTKNLIYACEGSSVKRFCHISSIAVLNRLNENGVIDESSDFNPKQDHSGYAITKHFSEMEVWRASAEGLNTVILNPGVIIGTGNWDSGSGLLFSTAEKHKYTFSGSTSYVDVRDVATIAIELMEKSFFKERFIVVSETMMFLDFIGIIRQKLGLATPKKLPKWVLSLGYFLNCFLGPFIPMLRMANKANIDSVTSMNSISNEKIIQRLNFQFIPISESIDFHLQNYIKTKKQD